jgi:hypothetical protein
MNKVIKRSFLFKLVAHHLSEMCGSDRKIVVRRKLDDKSGENDENGVWEYDRSDRLLRLCEDTEKTLILTMWRIDNRGGIEEFVCAKEKEELHVTKSSRA